MVDRLALADLTSVFIAVAEGIPRQAGQMERGYGFRSLFPRGIQGDVRSRARRRGVVSESTELFCILNI